MTQMTLATSWPASPHNYPSILLPEFYGVAYITGLRGVGKTTLALQFEAPNHTSLIDFDQKGEGLARRLGLAYYTNPVARAASRFGKAYNPLQMFSTVNEVWAEVPATPLVVIDNVSVLEGALAAEAKRDPRAYGVDPKKAESGAYGGVYPAVSNLVSGFVASLLGRGVKMVIGIAHVGNVWGGGAPVPGKWRGKGVDRWHELSVLSLALIPGEAAPIPAALVQKEAMGSMEFDSGLGSYVMRRRLPTRIPACTAAVIRGYLRQPANMDAPDEGEVPTSAEVAMFGDTFTTEQMQFVMLSTEAAKAEVRLEELRREGGSTAAAPAPTAEVVPASFPEALSTAARLWGKDLNALSQAMGLDPYLMMQAWETNPAGTWEALRKAAQNGAGNASQGA